MALALVGSCFETRSGEQWKKVGLALLGGQLREQIGDDGCHFEQSPMYQLRITYALLALLNTGDADLVKCVREPLKRMLKASSHMSHPDGGIALLGDSAFSIYNEPGELLNWWSQIEGDHALEAPAPAAFTELMRSTCFMR